MNLAEFLMFCSNFNIMYDYINNKNGIKRSYVQSVFKKVSPNTKNINLKLFHFLIEKLAFIFHK